MMYERKIGRGVNVNDAICDLQFREESDGKLILTGVSFGFDYCNNLIDNGLDLEKLDMFVRNNMPINVYKNEPNNPRQ